MKKLCAIVLGAALLPTILSGCADRNKLPTPLQVDQPADCERVLETVPEPALREGSDFRIDYFRMRGSLRVANKIIDSGRECIANQRNAYGGKGNP